MIDTLRAIGYSPETAIADLIDNSISAGCKNVWLRLKWAGRDSWLSLVDDGHGMSEDEVIDALRPGSKDPQQERAETDLGRFGLGLKTASFSQCRKLTVISKRVDTSVTYWTWDLDFVREAKSWKVVHELSMPEIATEIERLGHGTAIVWQKTDRLVADVDADHQNEHAGFLQTGERILKHLAMVFHRYIESGRLSIWFNNRKILAWNPFLPGKAATQIFSEERLLNGLVQIKGYVLPHRSKMTSEEEYAVAEGPKGWNEQQGFYIYRNERLLLAGDWLGMFRKEDHYKLARIQVDIPNALDKAWQIDIKKSVARPPHGIVGALRNYAQKVRNAARDVYRHRGATIHRKHDSEEFHQVWVDKKRHGKYHYAINRVHPVLSKLLAGMPHEKSREIEALLKFIEETVPVPLMLIREREEPDSQTKPFENTDHTLLRQTMEMIYGKFLADGKSPEEAKARLMLIDPFNQFPEYLEFLTP